MKTLACCLRGPTSSSPAIPLFAFYTQDATFLYGRGALRRRAQHTEHDRSRERGVLGPDVNETGGTVQVYLTDRGTIFATRRFRSTGWLVARYRARSHKRGTLHNRSPELVLAGPSHGRSPQTPKCVSQSSARCGATRQESPSDSPAPRAAENYSMQTLQQSGNGRCAPLQDCTRDSQVPSNSPSTQISETHTFLVCGFVVLLWCCGCLWFCCGVSLVLV